MPKSYDPGLLPSLVALMGQLHEVSDKKLWDYANYRGSMELAYAFASIFVPDIIEFQGGVFLAAKFSEDAFSRWMETLNGDLTKVETMMNHCHIGDFFLNAPGDHDLDDAVFRRFGEALRTTWRSAAQEAFPDLPIRVGWNGDNDSDDEYQLTLFLDRTGPTRGSP
jgi:hypothetical protein